MAIDEKPRYDRATESGQGGQGQGQGQGREQALDRQGVQELFSFRPHCCLFLFLCFPYSTPFDCPLDESNRTSEEVFDPSSTQHFLFLPVRLRHGCFFVHSFRPSLRCSYFDWTLDCLLQTIFNLLLVRHIET
jgi:hypothetical protein